MRRPVIENYMSDTIEQNGPRCVFFRLLFNGTHSATTLFRLLVNWGKDHFTNSRNNQIDYDYLPISLC